MTFIGPAISAIVFGFVILYTINYLRSKNAPRLPPGPKGLPILGNVNDLPKPGVLECHHWLQHREPYGTYS
jgi:hypothetical protein